MDKLWGDRVGSAGLWHPRRSGALKQGLPSSGVPVFWPGVSGVLCTVGHLAASLASALEMLTARPPTPPHCDNHTSPGDGATATPSRTTPPKVSLGFPSRSSLCLRLTPPHCWQMGPCSPSCWGLGPSVSPSECLYFRFFRAEGSECKWVKPSTQMLHFSGSQFSRL